MLNYEYSYQTLEYVIVAFASGYSVSSRSCEMFKVPRHFLVCTPDVLTTSNHCKGDEVIR